MHFRIYLTECLLLTEHKLPCFKLALSFLATGNSVRRVHYSVGTEAHYFRLARTATRNSCRSFSAG